MQHVISNLKGKQEVLLLHKEQAMSQFGIVAKDINQTTAELTKLQSQIDYLTQNPDTDLTTYFEPIEYSQYVLEPEMLFEEGDEIYNWINWFYSDIPVIKSKYLKFTGTKTNKNYSITELYGVVKTNHKLRTIEVHMSEPVTISLIDTNLYNLLRL